jgi:hypothetical protein
LSATGDANVVLHACKPLLLPQTSIELTQIGRNTDIFIAYPCSSLSVLTE